MKTREEIQTMFKDRKIPLTHQRLAVYEELSSRTDHPSAETLYDSLKKHYPSLSLATVYKTLQTLSEMGIVARIPSSTAQARFDARASKHHHALCGECGRILDVFDPRLDKLPSPKIVHFQVSGHSVHFDGFCADCAKARRRKT